jgi:integrase/recombinase XerC
MIPQVFGRSRHGAGYALINDGIDVRLVQEFLGHASITSTAIYTAISPKRLAGVRVR